MLYELSLMRAVLRDSGSSETMMRAP
jgi:hypothetical protein